MAKQVPVLDPAERVVGCSVHGKIHLIDPISAIIDTEQFQRLRYIKQLGSADRVYPTANHTRFTHSLGVYHLALKFAEKLWHRHPDKLDKTDVLCVSIAGLIHDIGHGPFSHTFDTTFMNRFKSDKPWKHEQGTIDMWHHLLKENPEVKKLLDKYLSDNDHTFIEELIMPPKNLIENNKWLPKGRQINKSFLFCIVSNPFDGLDVDKMDYFVRDAKNANVSHDFTLSSIDRLCDNIDIVYDEALRFERIGYKDKVLQELNSAFNARTKLYDVIYKHKTAVAIEEQVVNIMTLADPYLKFPGNDGKFYTMREAVHNMGAYQLVTDDIFTLIRTSLDNRLEPAKNLLKDLERRKIPRCVGHTCSKHPERAEKKCQQIKAFLDNKLKSSEYFVRKFEMHQGLGLHQHPLDKVFLFEAKHPDKKKRSRVSDQQRVETYKSDGLIKILVYFSSNVNNPKLVQELRNFISENIESQNVDSQNGDTLTDSIDDLPSKKLRCSL